MKVRGCKRKMSDIEQKNGDASGRAKKKPKLGYAFLQNGRFLEMAGIPTKKNQKDRKKMIHDLFDTDPAKAAKLIEAFGIAFPELLEINRSSSNTQAAEDEVKDNGETAQYASPVLRESSHNDDQSKGSTLNSSFGPSNADRNHLSSFGSFIFASVDWPNDSEVLVSPFVDGMKSAPVTV